VEGEWLSPLPTILRPRLHLRYAASRGCRGDSLVPLRRHHHLDLLYPARDFTAVDAPSVLVAGCSDQERGRSLMPSASRRTTSAMRAARRSGRRVVASM
jgi:hypothetical protein